MHKEEVLKIIDTLVSYIEDFVEFSGMRGVVLGLSGGVDSATDLMLAVRALPKEKVFCVMMPCESNPQDLEDAVKVANKCEVDYKVIDLESAYKELLKQITKPTTLTKANIKARLRMTTLYAFANQYEYLNMGTGNKSELAIGYITKYGDGGVDFEPLAGLYKTEIYEIATELGVPQSILEKAPSAGLWKGQTDESELGFSYEELDTILKLLEHNSMMNLSFEGSAFKILVQKYGADLEKVKKVVAMIQKSEHKRNMPPCSSRNLILSTLARE